MVDGFDLGRLTDRDFEEVCRDLFGEILGCPLEIFTRGPDGGVDLRHVSDDGHTVIVQCKHWRGSGTSTLLRRLRTDEAPKVRALKPDRYLLAVSVGLTPGNKDAILEDFTFALRTPSDIYGLDDLVGALRDRPRLVERHFRLWLSSTAVLQTVLSRASHLRSSWLRDELSRTAETFVPHHGFTRAAQVLNSQHVCVITGAPGVGKTTVAMMLAYWLMGHGFQAHEIESIDDIPEQWRDDEKQVFLHDDFLGETMLDMPGRLEARRLVSLIQRIRDNPGKALIMTTRGHLFGEAQRLSDRLSGPDVALAISAVELSDIDFGVRGQIIYNYVSRSRISQEQKARFAQPEVWEPLVSHRQFHPRIIAETTRLTGPETPDFAADLLDKLNNPLRIWETIVENELSSEAVELLEVLFLTGESKLEDLERFWARYRESAGSNYDRRAYRQALKGLDGSLIRIHDRFGQNFVRYHNPAVEDYFRHHLEVGRADLSALVASVDHHLQAYRVVQVARSSRGGSVFRFLTDNPSLVEDMILRAEATVPDSYWHEEDSLASYLVWALSAADFLGLSQLDGYIISRCEDLSLEAMPEEHIVELANALLASRMIPVEISQRFRRSVRTRVVEEIRECICTEHLLRAIELYQALVTLGDSNTENKAIRLIYAAVSDRLEYLTDLTDDELDEEIVGEVAGLLDFLDQADGHPVDTSTADAFLARHRASATRTKEPGAFPATRQHVPVDAERDSVSRLMRQFDSD